MLAIDFDGTIAQNDILDSDVATALAEIRAKGVVVVLVTGRILDDLRRVAGDLHFVDAVVAENGAVVAFPDSGYTEILAGSPPPGVLSELRVQGIPHAVGQVVVEAAAVDSTRILAVLQRLELPLVLVFNRSRVMVLPQAISKATGLRKALAILRLSEHNAVAIGDAENDHELLRACEAGVAVAWGSEALKRSADYVLPGTGPAAVANYIRNLGRTGEVSVPSNARRRLLVGHSDDGNPLALAVKGRNVLVAGDVKSGKSWVTGLLCEQLVLYGYSLCILDPEGDYTSLEALPGVVVFGGADPLPRPRELVRALRHADVSVVIDLSHTPYAEKVEYLRNAMPTMATLRRQTGLPHRIVVDEAHYFLQDSDVLQLLDLDRSGYTLVTYRASKLHRRVLDASQAIIVTRESDPNEVKALREVCGPCKARLTDEEWNRLLGELRIGEAVVLPVTEEAHGDIQRIRLAARLTPHIRHFAKYVDIPVPASRAFVFWRGDAPSGQRARTLLEFVKLVEHMRRPGLEGHLRRNDFSNWIGNVFGDFPLALKVKKIEDEYLAGIATEVGPALAQAIRSRYNLLDYADGCA